MSVAGGADEHWAGLDCDLGQVIRESVQDHLPLAEAGGVALALRGATGACRVSIDRTSLLRVLANLLTNAIRFTPSERLVSVAVVCRDGVATVSVHDQGPGMVPETLRHVFDRSTLQHSQRRGGGGFGLSIVKRIVDAHGGRVAAQSEAGAGTCLTITLPLVAGQQPAGRGCQPRMVGL
jgi:signal transduction histidine kinase